MSAFQRSALCLAALLALSVAGVSAQGSDFNVKPPAFGQPPGCPVFLFTTGVFCPPGFVNPSDECATAEVRIEHQRRRAWFAIVIETSNT